MLKLRVDSLGRLSSHAGRFCGAQCGCGCTKVAYDLAVKRATMVARVMGPKWRPRVHENLGWHAAAYINGTDHHVSADPWLDDLTYSAWIQLSPQYISTGHRNPVAAWHAARVQMGQNLRHILKAAELFEALAK